MSDSEGNEGGRETPPKKKMKHRAQVGNCGTFFRCNVKCFLFKKFKNSWMNIEEFKAWLRHVDGNVYKAQCILCNKQIVSELSTIRKHLSSTTHQTKAKLITTSSTAMLEKYLQSSAQIPDAHEAEIQLCGFLAEHNIAFKVMDHLCPLLSKIFIDSKIAKELGVRRTKAKAIVTNVIGATEKEKLCTILKKTKFSILVDESTDIAVTKTVCILVRYFAEELGKIKTSLWELLPLYQEETNVDYQGTADHLYKVIINTFTQKEIALSNIVGFASDGCNVMMGQHNSVSTRFLEYCPGIIILKCICHSLHICSSEACKSLPRTPEDLARNIYAFFKVKSKVHIICSINLFYFFFPVK